MVHNLRQNSSTAYDDTEKLPKTRKANKSPAAHLNKFILCFLFSSKVKPPSTSYLSNRTQKGVILGHRFSNYFYFVEFDKTICSAIVKMLSLSSIAAVEKQILFSSPNINNTLAKLYHLHHFVQMIYYRQAPLLTYRNHFPGCCSLQATYGEVIKVTVCIQ